MPAFDGHNPIILNTLTQHTDIQMSRRWRNVPGVMR